MHVFKLLIFLLWCVDALLLDKIVSNFIVSSAVKSAKPLATFS